MTTAMVVYRRPGWLAVELRGRFGMRALGVTETEVAEIVGDADFRAHNEKVPLSAADRAVLKSVLQAAAIGAVLRWYEPSRGYTARTYANGVMNVQQQKCVAMLLAERANEPAILDAPIDGADPLAPAFVDRLEDEARPLMRCLPPCDWAMVMEFFTREEFHIFEARLHNVSREVIRRELGYTPGVWKRVWRRFQRRAAFILDLEVAR